MIVYMPGNVPAGTTNDEAIHAVDFYKTYAEFANATLPAPATHTLDGESIAGILTGAQTELTRDTIFYHFPGYTIQNVPCSIAIHDGFDGNRYKLTYFYEDRSFEFYDLTNDIGEASNLIDSGMTQIQFEVGLNARAALTSCLLGISMTIEAEGSNPVLDSGVNGIGVRSDLDTGGATNRQRIDGSLATAETVVVSFDEDLLLKQLDLRALSGDGSESVQIQFVAGQNPFTGLSGYDTDGFSLSSDTLTFVRSDGSGPNNPLLLRLGRLDQDELFVQSGTTLRITASPAVGGGILVHSISTALAASIPNVASVAIDDDTAQRSAVESITLTFDGIVDVDADAISIVQLSDINGATGTPVASSFNASVSGGETIVDVTFDSLTRNSAGHLIDGNYQVTVDGEKVRLDGLQMTEDFIFGDVEADRFFSFYGDSNGDRTVNIFDLLTFRQSYRAVDGDTNYDLTMDYGADGIVNIFDLLQFRTRYRETLPFSFARSFRAALPTGKGISIPSKTVSRSQR